jgi:hypothetical protein
VRITADTTAADLEETLKHLSAAAHEADKRGNDLLHRVTHARIDDALECWQVLSALETSKPH